MNTFHVTLPSTFESVAEARRVVAAFVRGRGFTPLDVSDVILAVGEACNNAVEHGHVPGGAISIDCVHRQGVLTIAVSDAGPGFSPADRGAPTDGSMAFVGRGRGIAIMRALMDRVTFGQNDRGTRVVLEKREPAPALSAGRRSPAARRSARGDRETRRELSRLDADDRGQPR
jgi:anti-sigma regulatory factor (Ser/Thr protein kinase)